MHPRSHSGLAARTHGQGGNSRNGVSEPQATYASVAIAIPKGSNAYRMVTDYRAVNDTIEQAAMPTPILEDKASLFAGATAWCTFDYAARLLAGAAERGFPQELHHCHSEGLFTPRRVPPRVPNATRYFQETMGDVLEGYMDKICLVWVDDIVIWGKTPEIISKRLLAILDRLLERGLLAAAHKAVYFRKEIKCFFFFFFSYPPADGEK